MLIFRQRVRSMIMKIDAGGNNLYLSATMRFKFLIITALSVFTFIGIGTFLFAKDLWAIKRMRFNPQQTWIQQISNLWLVVVKPTTWRHEFIPNGSTTEDLFDIYRSLGVINGSYFRKDSQWWFHPAGAFVENGKTLAKSSFCDDPNICALFNTSTIDIKPIVYSGEYGGSRRSAGPMLLQSWVINVHLKKSFSHRNVRTKRTVLVYPGPYFIYTQKDYRLSDLASVLKKLFPKSTIVNLDGGPSTSFYGSGLKFNSDEILPEFFVLY